MKWSIGKGKYGPLEDILTGSWSDFRDLLADAATIPRAASEKESWWWVSPMLPHEGATQRRNDDVEQMANWFGMDLDDGNFDIDRLTYRMIGATWLCYSTASSTPDAQRWRIMLLLDRPYDPVDHERLFRWFNHRFSGMLCASTKNVSRLFYLPAAWNSEPSIFHSSYGRAIQVDSILAVTPPQPQPVINGSLNGNLKTAPDGTPVITGPMLAAACSAPEGGRLFRLLCQAAKRFRLMGWTLDANVLARAGLDASQRFAAGKPRKDIMREAQRAIAWAERHFDVPTPLERLRARIRWEEYRSR